MRLEAAPGLLRNRQLRQLVMAQTGTRMMSCLRCSKKPGSVPFSPAHLHDHADECSAFDSTALPWMQSKLSLTCRQD